MKTHIYREGENGSALCETCGKKVNTTFVRRDVPLSDNLDVVKVVLVGVCNTCDSVVAMPHQSAPRVKRTIDKQMKAIEARVPSHFKDMMSLVVAELHQSEAFGQQVFRYYIHQWSEHRVPLTRIRKYQRDPLFCGRADTRLSVKIADADVVIDAIRNKVTELSNKTDLLKAIAFAAFDDVVEKPKSRAKSALEQIAAVY